jgi:UDP-glucose 4-epimerase
MKVLITGVAGLLGSRMADWIVDNTEHTVIGIDDLSGGYEECVNKKVMFYKMNINDSHLLSKIFLFEKPDIVYHFAAYAAECLSPFIRNYNYTNNVVCTANIINECIKHDVKRLVFTSSMAVYGEAEAPFKESYTPNPKDCYGVAKYACEMDIQIAGEQHNLDWCILRPHNVYGIKQNIWDKYRNVLGIWMCQYMSGNDLTIFGDGEQTRAFSYIDDCLKPMWKAGTDSRASKQIINIGGTKEYTIKNAANLLLNIMGEGNVVHLEPRHEVKHAYSSHEKSIELLDYKDITPFEEGLKNMWEWAQKQTDKEIFIWDKYELDKGIYEYWKT